MTVSKDKKMNSALLLGSPYTFKVAHKKYKNVEVRNKHIQAIKKLAS